MKLFVALLTMFCLFSASAADDIETQAKQVFEKCEISTKFDRNSCSFGGCAAIALACQEQEIEFIKEKISVLLKTLKNTRCTKILDEFQERMKAMRAALVSSPVIESSWSRPEIELASEVFAYKVITSLQNECISEEGETRIGLNFNASIPDY